MDLLNHYETINLLNKDYFIIFTIVFIRVFKREFLTDFSGNTINLYSIVNLNSFQIYPTPNPIIKKNSLFLIFVT